MLFDPLNAGAHHDSREAFLVDVDSIPNHCEVDVRHLKEVLVQVTLKNALPKQIKSSQMSRASTLTLSVG